MRSPDRRTRSRPVGPARARRARGLDRLREGGKHLAGCAQRQQPAPGHDDRRLLVAYNYFNTGSISPGSHTSLSHSTRQTTHSEIFDISGWGNPSWIGNDRVLMFDASETFTGDTLIYTVGGSTQTWFEDPELSLSGGEVNAAGTRLAATNGTTLRLYKLNAPPPADAVDPSVCDLTGPTGTYFRPTWSPDGASLAWQKDDGVWVGSFDISTCQGSSRLVIPGAKAPDWGPANVTATPPQDKVAPKLKAKVAKRVRRRALLRGLTVKITCNEPCRATAELLVDRRTARRLGDAPGGRARVTREHLRGVKTLRGLAVGRAPLTASAEIV